MSSVRAAFEALVDYVGAIGWGALAAAAACHAAKLVVRTRSWFNILVAAYPAAGLRWRTVFGAGAAGVAVNSILPARGGDLLRLFLIRRRIEGGTYPTLAATLLVETLFDAAVSAALIAYAITSGVLPGSAALERLPEVDWLWVLHRPRLALALGLVAAVAAVIGVTWGRRRIERFRERVGQGFAVLRPPRRYLRHVVPWQVLDWVFRLGTIYFALIAFGLEADVENALRVQVMNGLSTILPLTPGGIGTEQALLVYAFRGQASAASVLSFSVGLKATTAVVNVALGFAAIALMLRTLRWRDHVATSGQRP